MGKKQLKSDRGLLFLTLLLLGCGLTVLYSASVVVSYNTYGTTGYYIIHQLFYGGLAGLVAMYFCSKIDYHFWQKVLPWLVLIALALLAAVKIPGVGYSAGGAHRWIHLGPLSVQPAEIAKLVIIFYLASWVDKRGKQINDLLGGLLPSLIITGLFAALILWQPDFGTMLVLLFVSLAMLFTAGVNIKIFTTILVVGLVALFVFIKLEPYRAKRLTTFLNPTIDPKGISYQINQARLAIGSGGWFGYGYGLSRQKYNYLPEAATDSIFAVMSEELGFVRVGLILLLFIFVLLRSVKVARQAPDMFGKMVAVGIVSWLAIQTLVNVGAMVNILPLTGIPLPFFSYGSTSLLMTLAAMGVLLNISRQTKSV